MWSLPLKASILNGITHIQVTLLDGVSGGCIAQGRGTLEFMPWGVAPSQWLMGDRWINTPVPLPIGGMTQCVLPCPMGPLVGLSPHCPRG